jgi:hypothetical protein
MSGRVSLLLIVGAFLLGSGVITPMLATPENQTPPGPARIKECGITITEPGAYELEGNLFSSSPKCDGINQKPFTTRKHSGGSSVEYNAPRRLFTANHIIRSGLPKG